MDQWAALVAAQSNPELVITKQIDATNARAKKGEYASAKDLHQAAKKAAGDTYPSGSDRAKNQFQVRSVADLVRVIGYSLSLRVKESGSVVAARDGIEYVMFITRKAARFQFEGLAAFDDWNRCDAAFRGRPLMDFTEGKFMDICGSFVIKRGNTRPLSTPAKRNRKRKRKSSEICRNFLAGRCNKGDACTYVHPRAGAPASSSKNKPTKPAQAYQY